MLGVGPGLTYSYGSTKYEYSASDTTNTTNTVSIEAKASAQYFISKNFCAFLDAGLQVGFANYKTEISSPSSSSTYTTTSFGTTTAQLGVAYLF